MLYQDQSQDEVADDAYQAEEIKAAPFILSWRSLILCPLRLIEVDLACRAGVVEVARINSHCAIDPAGVHRIAGADEGISAHCPARKYAHLASCCHQIGADISSQIDGTPDSHHLSAHIGVHIDLAASSNDVSLYWRVDVHCASGDYSRINWSVDIHYVSCGKDIILYGIDYGYRIARKGPQCLPTGGEE